MTDQSYDTVIIGAGLSGLIAARRVAEAGRSVLVLEKEGDIGGRQRTREVDGYLLDRGFQLLNPAYPSVKQHVDLDALDLHPFGSGVLVRLRDGLDLLAHPARHPQHVTSTLSSGLVTASEFAALAGWFGKSSLDSALPRQARDTPTNDAWDRAGITGPLRTQVLEPFLAGVLAESELSTSSDYVRFLLRMFALGRPSIPGRGIQAIPNQLAAKARRAGAEIRTLAPVESYSEATDQVTVEAAGETITAGNIIIAVGPEAVGSLTGHAEIPTRGLSTWWFRTDEAPTDKAFIAIDGTRSGPVLNTAVMTNAAPSCSPDGTPLIQASALLGMEPVGDEDARAHTARIWGMDAAELELIARDDIPHALPTHPAGSSTAKPSRLTDRTLLAGDHRSSPSIEGALQAGVRAASEALSHR